MELAKPKLKLRKSLDSIRSEYYPYVHTFVFWTGFGVHMYASLPALYDKVCRTLYSNETFTDVCSSLTNFPHHEATVQKETANWMMYMEFAAFFPNLFSVTLFGKHADHDQGGVKTSVLMAVASQSLKAYFFMICTASYMQWPLYSVLINNFFTAFGGTVTLFTSAQYTEVARITSDPQALTFRYTVLTSAWTLGAFMSGNFMTLLLTYFSYSSVILIGQSIMALTFMCSLLTRYSSPTLAIAKIVETIKPPSNKTNLSLSNITQKKPIHKKQRKNVIKHLAEIYSEAWKTLVMKRPGRKRIYLILILLVGLIYTTCENGLNAVLSLYTFRAPLSWSPQAFSRFRAWLYISQLISGVLSVYVFKRLKFSDTFIALIGILSCLCKLVTLSVANETWLMYLALGMGCLSTVGFSGLRSFLALLGSKCETGSLMALQSLTMSWSAVISAVVFNNIYSATLTFFKGFIFAYNATLLFLCFLLILFVHIDYKKNEEEKAKEPEITKF